MNRNHLNLEPFSCSAIHGGYTLQTPEVPERGSLALHICDNPEDVLNARVLLAQDTLPLDHWVLAWQKHTGRVIRVSAQDRGRGALEAESSILETDGLYTTDPDVLIGVFTADCLGILLYDPAVPFVAAVHSGWRGTAQKIGVKTVQKMGGDPKDTIAIIGPAIGLCCYEVSDDVREKLLTTIQDTTNLSKNNHVDLKSINARQLQEIGVEKIDICPYCTSCNNDLFYSYRKENGTTQRHFAFLQLP